MRLLSFTALGLTLGLALTGCGTAYQGVSVQEGLVDGMKVQVMPLTSETLLVANRAPFNPRSLPAAFRATAGLHGSARADRLPDPVHSEITRGAMPSLDLPPPPPAEAYRIGVGDVVLLATRRPGTTAAELSGLLAAENRRQGYTVQDDGAITIPDVGRVVIAGKTLEEAEAQMFQRLLDQQMDPSFSLEVAQFNARRVTIGGAVVSPGVMPVTLTPLTLDAALADAGGINASDRSAAVIRIYRQGQLYQIPAEEFLTSPQLQKTRLIDGDSIFVDTEYDLERAEAWFGEQIRLTQVRTEARQAAMSMLAQEISLRRNELAEQRDTFTARLGLGAEKRDQVYLTGEIGTPGAWDMPFEQRATLAQALFERGGITRSTGNPRQIYVMRGSNDPREFGAITAWHVNAGTPAGLVMATRMELRPDDVIFVAEQPVTRWNRVINQITPSLIAIPVNHALDSN